MLTPDDFRPLVPGGKPLAIHIDLLVVGPVEEADDDALPAPG